MRSRALSCTFSLYQLLYEPLLRKMELVLPVELIQDIYANIGYWLPKEEARHAVRVLSLTSSAFRCYAQSLLFQTLTLNSHTKPETLRERIEHDHLLAHVRTLLVFGGLDRLGASYLNECVDIISTPHIFSKMTDLQKIEISRSENINRKLALAIWSLATKRSIDLNSTSNFDSDTGPFGQDGNLRFNKIVLLLPNISLLRAAQPTVRQLHLSHFNFSTAPELPNLVFPNLEFFRYYGNIPHQMLMFLAKNPTIRTLKFDSLKIPPSFIVADNFLPNLEDVDLSMSTLQLLARGDRPIKKISQATAQILSFPFAFTTRITHLCLGELPPDAPTLINIAQNVSTKFTKLEVLAMHFRVVEQTPETCLSIIHYISKLKNLRAFNTSIPFGTNYKVLDIEAANELFRASLKVLSAHCPQLESLRFDRTIAGRRVGWDNTNEHYTGEWYVWYEGHRMIKIM